jgi:hypothetical protein
LDAEVTEVFKSVWIPLFGTVSTVKVTVFDENALMAPIFHRTILLFADMLSGEISDDRKLPDEEIESINTVLAD